MKKIITLCFLIVAAANVFGQQVTFQKTYGGTGVQQGFCVHQTTDGGYIITGITYSFGAGGSDVYLIKTDINGDTLWTKTFGGTANDWGYSVQQTSDGGYIIAGTTNSFGSNDADVYLIKTDSIGDSLWTKTFSGTSDDLIYSVMQTFDGGYILGGTENGLSTNLYDGYLIKTDTNGNLIWTKTFDVFKDAGNAVVQTSDSGYIITGKTQNPGASYEVYLVKTDVNGNSLWTKTFGGINYDEGNSVLQTADGGYVIAGVTSSFGAGGQDIYLIKTIANGDTLWTKTFGGTGNDQSYCIYQTADGGYIIVGSTDSLGTGDRDVYLIKTDSAGDTLWTKTIGGTGFDQGYSVQQTTDGGYVITGWTDNFGLGGYDVYLIKTDSLGNTGCNQGSIATITTSPATQVTSPATIDNFPAIIVTTPATIVGSGGIVTTLCTTVGIQSTIQNPQSAISISPNPATNNFTITFPNTINKGTIEIYDVMEKKKYKENIAEVSQKEIGFKNIGAGIYFVKVRDREKEYCEKLLIEK